MSENQEPNNASSKPQENGGVAQKAQETVQKAKKAKETAQKIKKLAHAVKNISASGPLMYVLFWAFVVIVIIIIIIGILMFLITMPGMVMGKLKELFAAIGSFCAALFGADTTTDFAPSRIYETLDYIEDMGWDLKGEGFLTGYYKLGDEKKIEEELDDLDFDFDNKSYEPDPKQGVVRDGDDKIVLAKSDFIFTYIMSDNYVYTLKNDNIATQRDDGFWSSVFDGMEAFGHKMNSLVFGSLNSNVNNEKVEEYGKGLIALYYDKGFGKIGDALDMYNIWTDGVVDIDTEEKTLLIENDGWFNNNNPIKFSLDGWTGRYGMPLEFLLSVHKATMMPDLAYDMVYTFNTNINIYLHEVSGQAIAAYKSDKNGKYITAGDLNEALSGLRGENWFSALLSWFDNLIDTQGEAIAAYELGVTHIFTGEAPCECNSFEEIHYDEGYNNIVGWSEDKQAWYYYKNGKKNDGLDFERIYEGQVYTEQKAKKPCDYCQKAVGVLADILDASNDYDFEAYAPYIANVQRHWYRDVYFVIEENKDFVEYDYDYEALMKERWTLYETYTDKDKDKGTYKYNPNKAGEFIYFIIDAERKIQRRKWSVCIV